MLRLHLINKKYEQTICIYHVYYIAFMFQIRVYFEHIDIYCAHLALYNDRVCHKVHVHLLLWKIVPVHFFKNTLAKLCSASPIPTYDMTIYDMLWHDKYAKFICLLRCLISVMAWNMTYGCLTYSKQILMLIKYAQL